MHDSLEQSVELHAAGEGVAPCARSGVHTILPSRSRASTYRAIGVCRPRSPRHLWSRERGSHSICLNEPEQAIRCMGERERVADPDWNRDVDL